MLAFEKFTFTTLSNDATTMKLYIRNIAYGCVLFMLITVLQLLTFYSNARNCSSCNNGAENRRFKRSIDLKSQTEAYGSYVGNKNNFIAQNSNGANIFDSIREGPAVDLGKSFPAKLGKDVFISVKTTFKYHSTRLKDILETWFRLAPEKIYLFTDRSDANMVEQTGGHLINTNCSSSHSRQALCCKMSVEFDYFLASEKSWFCHFDDDNYVNVPELMRLLSMYDPTKDWYLGRPSTRGPIEILDREHAAQKISFWFATGGAGFCISRSLALKMAPYASKRKFISLGERIRLPDDVTMGHLIEHLLGKHLTVVNRFHSHLESMKMIKLDTLHEQVSLSAGSYSADKKNVVPVDGPFTSNEDPNRFRSIHCFLFPNAHVCRERSNRQSKHRRKVAKNQNRSEELYFR